MVDAHFAGAVQQVEDNSVLPGLRQSLKEVLHENRLLEQKLSSVKELSVSMARWLVQGSAVEIRPLCKQAQPYGEDVGVVPETPALNESQPRSKRSRNE